MTWPHLLTEGHLPAAPTAFTNRLIAVHCALQLTRPSVIATGASHAGDVTTRARTFEEWLNNSTDEQDAHLRRLLLTMVCDKADPSAPTDRIRALAKELHHFITRG